MQEDYSYHHRELTRRLRKNPTPAEQCLWRHLRKRKMAGVRFRRQAPVGRYIVDFVCFELKLIIELDGEIHLEQQTYDEIRDEWLKSRGFTVLRIENQHVLKQIDTTLLRIQNNIELAL